LREVIIEVSLPSPPVQTSGTPQYFALGSDSRVQFSAFSKIAGPPPVVTAGYCRSGFIDFAALVLKFQGIFSGLCLIRGLFGRLVFFIRLSSGVNSAGQSANAIY
jgi:hypothetical protein